MNNFFQVCVNWALNKLLWLVIFAALLQTCFVELKTDVQIHTTYWGYKHVTYSTTTAIQYE